MIEMGLKEFWLEFEGPFTKKGAYIDWDEVHAFGLGALAGVRSKSLESSYEQDDRHTDYYLEWTYYKSGYAVGNKLKWFLAGLVSAVGAASLTVL